MELLTTLLFSTKKAPRTVMMQGSAAHHVGDFARAMQEGLPGSSSVNTVIITMDEFASRKDAQRSRRTLGLSLRRALAPLTALSSLAIAGAGSDMALDAGYPPTWSQLHFPCLADFRMHNLYFSVEAMQSFITAHRSTLRRVEVVNCLPRRPNPTQPWGVYTWYPFLKTLAQLPERCTSIVFFPASRGGIPRDGPWTGLKEFLDSIGENRYGCVDDPALRKGFCLSESWAGSDDRSHGCGGGEIRIPPFEELRGLSDVSTYSVVWGPIRLR